MSLISNGLTNRQIADELNLAEKTVKNYVSALLHKLDMTRRAEAAAFRAAITDVEEAEIIARPLARAIIRGRRRSS